MAPIIIIGTGLAGYTLAREFRHLDKATPLILVSADDGVSYSKPMLSSALGQGKTAAGLVLTNAEKMAATLGAEILTQTTATVIRPAEQAIELDSGRRLTYRDLVLAVGAQPMRPSFTGVDGDNVLSINNLADYTRFRARLDSAASVAIIGSGLIGCEFANDLIQAGKAVTVIGRAATPIPGLLPEPVGEFLSHGLAKAGVQWKLGVETTAIENAGGEGYLLRLNDGDSITADVVLSAIGLRADTRLAQAADLATGRGITTDAYLGTSKPHIHALGDCAEVEGRNLPFVAPLIQGAKALAKTLAGQPTPVAYPIMPVIVKTPACPVAVVPPSSKQGAWQVDADDNGARALWLTADGQLGGFAVAGKAATERQALVKRMESDGKP